MKKPPIGPLVALALLAGLSAWIVFKEAPPGQAPKDDAKASDRAIEFSREALKSITLTSDQGEFRVEKEGDTWRIAAPIRTGADKEAIEGLLSAIESAHVERRIGAGEELKTYGLDPPGATLSLDVGEGAPRTLRLGAGNPIGGTWYAQLPAGGEVAVITSSGGEFSRKDLLALRDKSLIDLDAWKVRRLAITRPGGSVSLEKIEDAWTVKTPVEAPADGPTITDLLTALQNLRARSFPAETPTKAELRRFGLEPPVARLSLLQEGWDVEKTILFGKATGENRYARPIGRDAVLEVPGDIWEKIGTRLDDLRRKDLLGVGQYRVQTVTAIRPGQESLTLTREPDGSWDATGLATGKVKADTMDTLLRHVSALKATRFNDRPTEADRTRLLRHPALDLTLAEEAPAEGGSTKTQHLVIGSPDRTGKVRVRDMAWRPIAEAPVGALQNINQQLDAVLKEARETPPAPDASSPAEAASAEPSSSPDGASPPRH